MNLHQKTLRVDESSLVDDQIQSDLTLRFQPHGEAVFDAKERSISLAATRKMDLAAMISDVRHHVARVKIEPGENLQRLTEEAVPQKTTFKDFLDRMAINGGQEMIYNTPDNTFSGQGYLNSMLLASIYRGMPEQEMEELMVRSRVLKSIKPLLYSFDRQNVSLTEIGGWDMQKFLDATDFHTPGLVYPQIKGEINLSNCEYILPDQLDVIATSSVFDEDGGIAGMMADKDESGRKQIGYENSTKDSALLASMTELLAVISLRLKEGGIFLSAGRDRFSSLIAKYFGLKEQASLRNQDGFPIRAFQLDKSVRPLKEKLKFYGRNQFAYDQDGKLTVEKREY